MGRVPNASKRRSIPLLDIRLFQTNPSQFVEELRRACHRIGFFVLRHDLQPPSLPIQQLEEATRFFVEHSLEEKMQISYEKSPSFRGFRRLGVEQTAGRLDVREQIEVVAEYDDDDYSSTENDDENSVPYYERLKVGRNQWPFFQPTLQETTERYLKEILRIAVQLQQALCLALGLDRHAADSLFGDRPHWGMKLVSYPPAVEECEEEDHALNSKHDKNNGENDNSTPASSLGVGSHTDTNFLTLILQDGTPGLQAFTAAGEWIDVPETGPDCLICNLGEQAEILSGGYLLATPHRVQRPKRQRRTSVPFFYNPALSAIVQPLINIDNKEGSLPRVLPWERDEGDPQRWRMSNSRMLTSVGENTFKSFARSHPTVFARHHPDLEQVPTTGQVVRRQRAPDQKTEDDNR